MNDKIISHVPDVLFNEILSYLPSEKINKIFLDGLDEDLFNMMFKKQLSVETLSLALKIINDGQNNIYKLGIPAKFNNINYDIIANFILKGHKDVIDYNCNIVRIYHKPLIYWKNIIKSTCEQVFNTVKYPLNFDWFVSEKTLHGSLYPMLPYLNIDSRLRFLKGYEVYENDFESFYKSFYYQSLESSIINDIILKIQYINGVHNFVDSFPCFSDVYYQNEDDNFIPDIIYERLEWNYE